MLERYGRLFSKFDPNEINQENCNLHLEKYYQEIQEYYSKVTEDYENDILKEKQLQDTST
jgi:hypothetical protein